MLEKKLADTEATPEEQTNIRKYLEKKETEYMHLQRHKMGAEDFEPLTMIGKGAFVEIVETRTALAPAKHQFVAIDIFNRKVFKATFPLRHLFCMFIKYR